MDDLGYGQAANWLNRERFFQPQPRILPRPGPQRPSPRDISEPPPSNVKRRLPLPDIFYYGDRWQEQESRSRSTHPNDERWPEQEFRSRSTHPNVGGSSLETPEPPPGSDLSNNNNR